MTCKTCTCTFELVDTVELSSRLPSAIIYVPAISFCRWATRCDKSIRLRILLRLVIIVITIAVIIWKRGITALSRRRRLFRFTRLVADYGSWIKWYMTRSRGTRKLRDIFDYLSISGCVRGINFYRPNGSLRFRMNASSAPHPPHQNSVINDPRCSAVGWKLFYRLYLFASTRR